MKLPFLNEMETSRSVIDIFGGYNHNPRIGESEFYEMKNMSSSNFPLLSPRAKRGIAASPQNPQAILAKDQVGLVGNSNTYCYINGTYFCYGKHTVDLGLSLEPKMCPKKMISIGAYVVIMPDKKWINTAKLGDTEASEEELFGDIDVKNEAKVIHKDPSRVTMSACNIDGEEYTIDFAQSRDPRKDRKHHEPVVNGTMWFDTSDKTHVLKQFSESTMMWVPIPMTYVKISAPGIGKGLSAYDGVDLDGMTYDEMKEEILDKEHLSGDKTTGFRQLTKLYGLKVIWKCEEDYIVVQGCVHGKYVFAAINGIHTLLTVERKMPAVDYVVEAGNRLWGCRYGLSNDGKRVNEIYASRLGDFKSWNSFAGISSDSYAASCGTDGAFTGAITHMGYPIFFKENCMHKVYGNFPANYQIQTTSCSGVQKGCSESLAIVNEVLYYKSRSGICVYDGSMPAEIHNVFGDETYGDAVAGAHLNKYYISMRGNEGYRLFVYDTAKGLWHAEDDLQAGGFCSCSNDLFVIDKRDNKIKEVVQRLKAADEEDVRWMVESGVIGLSMPDQKYLSRMTLRMLLTVGASVSISVQYDSCGAWETVASLVGSSLRSFSIPILPKRCDHMRIRIEGKGDAKIFSITKTLEQGSDVS